MARRGSFSLIAMVVINPMVILFYQNCSVIPSKAAPPKEVVREVSSIKEPSSPLSIVCHPEKASCPQSSID